MDETTPENKANYDHIQLGKLRQEITDAARGDRHVVIADFFVQEWKSNASQPVAFHCKDGKVYVFKGSQNQKMIVADHIVGRLGQLMGAPVGAVTFAEIPDVLRLDEPAAQHFGPGLCHATLFIKDCTDKDTMLKHLDVVENRNRFAHLAVLFSWTIAGDPQFIYLKNKPYLVFSVDHGHFLPSGPNWTIDSLRTANDDIQLLPLFATSNLGNELFTDACTGLSRITDEDIQHVVLGPPAEWGITEREREILTEMLIRRRDKCVEAFSK